LHNLSATLRKLAAIVSGESPLRLSTFYLSFQIKEDDVGKLLKI
jgi:hypothetical protein